MERFNLYASNHKVNGDNKFYEGLEVETWDEMREEAKGFASVWGCDCVNVYQDGEIVDQVDTTA